MKSQLQGFMTVEAALLYPYLFFITILLIQLTVARYGVVCKQAGMLYDAAFTGRKWETSELVRLTDTAFEFFE